MPLNTFKWYLGISVLFLISACTSYNIQKRQYTKGLYWNTAFTQAFKKNKSKHKNTIEVAESIKPNDQNLKTEITYNKTALKQYETYTDNLHRNLILALNTTYDDNNIIKYDTKNRTQKTVPVKPYKSKVKVFKNNNDGRCTIQEPEY